VGSPRTCLVNLPPSQRLEQIIQRQGTSCGNSTQDVRTSTVEQSLCAFFRDDLPSCVNERFVTNLFSRRHHHTAADCVHGIRRKCSTCGASPTHGKRGQEITLQVSDKEGISDSIIASKVEPPVDDDTENIGDKAPVKTNDPVRTECLSIDVYDAGELTLSSLGCALPISSKPCSSVVEGIYEDSRRRPSGSTTGDITYRNKVEIDPCDFL